MTVLTGTPPTTTGGAVRITTWAWTVVTLAGISALRTSTSTAPTVPGARPAGTWTVTSTVRVAPDSTVTDTGLTELDHPLPPLTVDLTVNCLLYTHLRAHETRHDL